MRALRDWRERIEHVHVKDVRRSVFDGAADLEQAWREGMFCELGAGDVDLHGFFSELAAGGYGGWVVVEQDRIPRAGEPLTEAAEAQARNRRWLAENVGL